MIKIKEFRDKQEFIRKEGCTRTTETAIESANKFLSTLHDKDIINVVVDDYRVIITYKKPSNDKPIDSYMHG